MILDLFQMKHLTNGNQWNEDHVVTTHVFERIYITALFWVITQRVVVIPHRRFEKPIGPIFKGNNPEERNSHLLRGGSLKSRRIYTVIWAPDRRKECYGNLPTLWR
jgi:hypothetical protein